jgi:hypothetical protein
MPFIKLAYAFLMNGIYPNYAHPIQDQMQVALAQFNAPAPPAPQAQARR